MARNVLFSINAFKIEITGLMLSDLDVFEELRSYCNSLKTCLKEIQCYDFLGGKIKG